VLIRFNGEPDDLLDRFEQARRRWIEAQERDYDRPLDGARPVRATMAT
jgi:hypothetical protein